MSDNLPESIGKYRVIREIGQGATSSVYLAEDAFHDRQVAIKVVRTADTGDSELNRRYQRVFMNEAALAGKLNHPHIVSIYDAATDDDMSYVVMEHVAGGTLEQFCAPDALLPFDRLVEIVFKAGVALEYAYRQGVIHCDIKPANILIRKDSESDIRISDFGASFFGHAAHTFLTGIGSPAYMSPEQVQEKQLTHQTDIYSLGVVMYQLLTGKLPFQGSNRASLLYQVVNIEPRPPSSLRPGIPKALDAIVMRTLAKARADRYETWKAFTQALSTVFQELTLPQEAVSDTEKFTLVRGLAFFRDFRDVDVWEALRMARWHRLEAGKTILREGDWADGFYVLATGRIEVSRGGRPLDTLGAGHCFGEILYFESAPSRRTTTVRARETCMAMEFDAKDLQRASPSLQLQFNRTFMRILIDRLERRESRLALDLSQVA